MKGLKGGRSVLTVAALVGAAAVAVVPADTASAVPPTFTNACRNSAVPTNWDQVSVTTSGTSPAGPVAPGDSVSLTGLSLDMSIPGAIFVAGYNLGLLTAGANAIPGDIHEVIDATNATQASQSTNTVSTTLNTTITDPDGTPGSGDETASDASASADFNDQTWTAGSGGTMDFAEHNDTAITGAAGGGVVAIAHLAGGAFNVQFHCTAGSVTNPGNPAPPAVVTFADAPTITSTPIADTTPPKVTVSAPSTPFALASSATLRWTASDAGSGVAGFQARYRKAAPTGGFGSWAMPTGWGNLAASKTSVTLSGLTAGYDYCFQVNGVDNADNRSAWTPAKCVARPLDDRALALSKNWTKGTGKSYWNSTVTSTKTLGATAKFANAQLDRVGIVATFGPGMGTVGVYVGTKLIGKIALAAPSKHYRGLLPLPKFSLRTGTVTVKVLTSGKAVELDGLAISRS